MEKNAIIEFVKNARKEGKTYENIVTEFNKNKATTPKGRKFTKNYLYSFMTTNDKATKKRTSKGVETGNATTTKTTINVAKLNAFANTLLNDIDMPLNKRVQIVHSFFDIYR